MGGGFGENALDDAFGQLAGALILLLHDRDTLSDLDVFATTTVLIGISPDCLLL